MANLVIGCGPSSLKMKTLLVSLLSCASISQAAITPVNSGLESGAGTLLTVENLALPAQWVSNLGFEVLSLSTSWTVARLPYNTSASLEQAFSGLPADFTADLSFQIADNAANRPDLHPLESQQVRNP